MTETHLVISAGGAYSFDRDPEETAAKDRFAYKRSLGRLWRETRVGPLRRRLRPAQSTNLPAHARFPPASVTGAEVGPRASRPQRIAENWRAGRPRTATTDGIVWLLAMPNGIDNFLAAAIWSRLN